MTAHPWPIHTGGETREEARSGAGKRDMRRERGALSSSFWRKRGAWARHHHLPRKWRDRNIEIACVRNSVACVHSLVSRGHAAPAVTVGALSNPVGRGARREHVLVFVCFLLFVSCCFTSRSSVTSARDAGKPADRRREDYEGAQQQQHIHNGVKSRKTTVKSGKIRRSEL